jgi:hypothetical protein
MSKLIILLIVLTTPLSAKDLVLVNETGFMIAQIYLSHIDVPSVKVNVLPDKLPSSKETAIHLADDWTRCNLRITFTKGGHIDWNDFDLSNLHKIVFQLIKGRVNAHYE